MEQRQSSGIELQFICPLRSSAFQRMDDGTEYCKRCDMCIVDCTDKSPEDIARLKAETPGKLCISVYADQLSHSYPRIQWRRFVGMFIMFFGLTPAWSQQAMDPGKTLPNGKQGCEIHLPEEPVRSKEPKEEAVKPQKVKRRKFRRRRPKIYGKW